MCGSFYIRVRLIQLFTKEFLNTYYSMILFKVPLVVPTYALGKAMLLLNAMFGILGQVCYPVPVSPSPRILTQVCPTYAGSFHDRSSI